MARAASRGADARRGRRARRAPAVAAFGPATAAEIGDWAGVAPAEVRDALEGMDLRRLRDEDGRELVDLPRAPLPDPDTPAPPRFLPTWDAVLLVHCRAAGVLAEEDRPRVFTSRNPHSLPTFLVDGTVAGTWRLEGTRVALDPWRPLAPGDRDALEEEAARLAAFHAEGPDPGIPSPPGGDRRTVVRGARRRLGG